MKIAISAESTVDMTEELLAKFDIHTLPFTIVLGEEEYLDGSLSNEEMFDYFNKTKKLPKTSAVNQDQFREHFSKLLESYDAIVHITLSSKLTSAYANAVEVAKEFENVYVFDSQTLSTGIAMLAIKASEMAQRGMEPDEILFKLEKIRPNVVAGSVIDTLTYLYRGGRCSSLAAFGANLLHIRPQIIVDSTTGTMRVGKKFIGSNENALKKYCEEVLNGKENDLDHIFITYTTATESMINVAREAVKKRGFKNVYETRAGATVSCHCGPKTLGLFFIKKG